MVLVRRIVLILLLLSSTVPAAPIVLYDFETGFFTSFMESAEVTEGSWNGEVSESTFGFNYMGKMRINNIAYFEFDASYTDYDLNWKNTSSLPMTGGRAPFSDLAAWNLETEYNKEINTFYTFFTEVNGSMMYEDSMGGISVMGASGLYTTYNMGALSVKLGGGIFLMQTPSDKSYMPFEKKSGSTSYGLYPYFKMIWNENTTGKYRQGGTGYLEYGKGMVLKGNLTTVHNQIYSMDYFFISKRGEFALDDGSPIAPEGYLIKEEMNVGIRSNFMLQKHMKLSCEVYYIFERKWEILDVNSDSQRTLKPDASMGALIKLSYVF